MIEITIVDDDKEEAAIINTFLVKEGYTPTCIYSAEKALETITIKKQIPQILIVDLNMPEMNGLDFIKELQKSGYDLPIILTCTDPDKELMDQVLDLGIGEILHKPISKNELLTEIKEIIEEFGL